MDLQAFESRFAILDEIPESLFSAVVTHTHGTLLLRAAGLLQWRQALLDGQLPREEELDWPEPALCRLILKRLEALDIVRYCKDEPTLTDTVLESILEGVTSAEDYFSKAGDFDDRLAQQQKIRDRDSEFEDDDGIADHAGGQAGGGAGAPGEGGGGEGAAAETGAGHDDTSAQTGMAEAADAENGDGAASGMEGGAAEAEAAGDGALSGGADNADAEMEQASIGAEGASSDAALSGQTPDPLSEALERRWGELAMSWQELAGVLDELGTHLGRGWDLTRGILASEGWRDISRYRKLLQALPELARLVAMLGRLRGESGGEHEGALIDAVTDPLRRDPEQAPRSLADHAVDTTEGIKLSDDIARMLPAESALLGHPTLNTLWHARRAESMLRCYQLQGVLSQHSPEPDPEAEQPQDDSGEQPGHGPIIVCLDTSASMSGEAETIAKAVTLEALRIAAGEQRRCFIISFSGEDQSITWQLDFTRPGYRDLLGFLRQSFHGGTDVRAALERAIDQLQDEQWQQADILLISDGRFPFPETLQPRLNQLRDQLGARIHGLLIGRWHSPAMTKLCNPLHRYDQWRSGFEA